MAKNSKTLGPKKKGVKLMSQTTMDENLSAIIKVHQFTCTMMIKKT